jgi:hypothetical protein
VGFLYTSNNFVHILMWKIGRNWKRYWVEETLFQNELCGHGEFQVLRASFRVLVNLCNLQSGRLPVRNLPDGLLRSLSALSDLCAALL